MQSVVERWTNECVRRTNVRQVAVSCVFTQTNAPSWTHLQSSSSKTTAPSGTYLFAVVFIHTNDASETQRIVFIHTNALLLGLIRSYVDPRKMLPLGSICSCSFTHNLQYSTRSAVANAHWCTKYSALMFCQQLKRHNEQTIQFWRREEWGNSCRKTSVLTVNDCPLCPPSLLSCGAWVSDSPACCGSCLSMFPFCMAPSVAGASRTWGISCWHVVRVYL